MFKIGLVYTGLLSLLTCSGGGGLRLGWGFDNSLQALAEVRAKVSSELANIICSR